MNSHLMSLCNYTPLFIRVKHRNHGRDKKSRWGTIMCQHFKNSWDTYSRPILSLAKLAGGVVSPSQGLRLMIRVKRQCNSNFRIIWPTIGPKRFSCSNFVHNASPFFFRPTPTFWLVWNGMSCFVFHGFALLKTKVYLS